MACDPASILALLPQTQCTRCGYPDCAAYASAITHGHAGINQCPPGGAEGIRRLAAATGQPEAGLRPENGVESFRSVAIIDEVWCIGCTLCVDACPTDAILGSNKTMHTVIEPYCTGCELCIPVCPVDCIQLENVSGSTTGWGAWSQAQADQARDRYAQSGLRRNRDALDAGNRLEPAEPGAPPARDCGTNAPQSKKELIAAVLQRARTKRSQREGPG